MSPNGAARERTIHGTQVSPGALIITHLLFADKVFYFFLKLIQWKPPLLRNC